MGANPEEVTPEQIRERMADTRAALKADLDRLRVEANPKTLIRHTLSGARGKAHDAKGKAQGATGKARGRAHDATEKARSKAHDATDRARGKAHDALDAAAHVRDRAAAPLARSSAGAPGPVLAQPSADDGPGPVLGMAGRARRQVAQRPVLAAVAATVLGVAVGLLVPGPRRR